MLFLGVNLLCHDIYRKDHVLHEKVASKGWPDKWEFLNTKYEDVSIHVNKYNFFVDRLDWRPTQREHTKRKIIYSAWSINYPDVTHPFPCQSSG